jgi:hypothetical protein
MSVFCQIGTMPAIFRFSDRLSMDFFHLAARQELFYGPPKDADFGSSLWD